jgi:integrase
MRRGKHPWPPAPVTSWPEADRLAWSAVAAQWDAGRAERVATAYGRLVAFCAATGRAVSRQSASDFEMEIAKCHAGANAARIMRYMIDALIALRPGEGDGWLWLRERQRALWRERVGWPAGGKPRRVRLRRISVAFDDWPAAHRERWSEALKPPASQERASYTDMIARDKAPSAIKGKRRRWKRKPPAHVVPCHNNDCAGGVGEMAVVDDPPRCGESRGNRPGAAVAMYRLAAAIRIRPTVDDTVLRWASAGGRPHVPPPRLGLADEGLRRDEPLSPTGHRQDRTPGPDRGPRRAGSEDLPRGCCGARRARGGHSPARWFDAHADRVAAGADEELSAGDDRREPRPGRRGPAGRIPLRQGGHQEWESLWREFEQNPFEDMRLEAPDPRKIKWEPGQVLRFCRKAEELGQLSVAVGAMFCYELGQRVGDARRLTRGAFERKRIRVVQHKTDTELMLPVSEVLLSYVEKVPIDQRQLVLNERTGEPYQDYELSKAAAKIREAAELPSHLFLMDLRRTCLSELGDLGATDDELMSVSGHATRQMLTIYSVRSYKRALAAMQRRWDSRNTA